MSPIVLHQLSLESSRLEEAAGAGAWRPDVTLKVTIITKVGSVPFQGLHCLPSGV